VVCVSGRHTNRAVQIGQGVFRRVNFRFLNAAFDFANSIEVMTDCRAIGWTELAPEAGDILIEGIEQTGFFAQGGFAFREDTSKDRWRDARSRSWTGTERTYSAAGAVHKRCRSRPNARDNAPVAASRTTRVSRQP